jgi:DNA repair exonuclease
MTKILFTADWHIKLGQKNVPIGWAKNRYRMFFDQVNEASKDVGLHIIGGDLFDRLPSLEDYLSTLSLYAV